MLLSGQNPKDQIVPTQIKTWIIIITVVKNTDLEVLQPALSGIQFANSLVLICTLKLKVSIRVSRDIISALSVLLRLAG